ncbi:MAG: adenylate/guanylate cyclase domain-containing protein, partial [Acidimicrobiales bacterium]
MSTPPGPSERRLLTVAFCDLVGSTALSAGIDDETYAEVMARYYASAQKVVTGHGGFVARREGDGIFVYIGHPHPHEDDADRAVRMGLELVETISRIHDGRGGRLRGRVGIHTGPTVMVRSELEPTSMAFGFTPNFAARLEGTAEPGQVLISSATAALLRGEFDLGEHVNVPIDDTTSLTARPVLAAHDRNRLVSTRLPAPFVGRGDLLARLHERWAEAVLVGTRPVVVVGEPGGGKARRAAELI